MSYVDYIYKMAQDDIDSDAEEASSKEDQSEGFIKQLMNLIGSGINSLTGNKGYSYSDIRNKFFKDKNGNLVQLKGYDDTGGKFTPKFVYVDPDLVNKSVNSSDVPMTPTIASIYNAKKGDPYRSRSLEEDLLMNQILKLNLEKGRSSTKDFFNKALLSGKNPSYGIYGGIKKNFDPKIDQVKQNVKDYIKKYNGKKHPNEINKAVAGYLQNQQKHLTHLRKKQYYGDFGVRETQFKDNLPSHGSGLFNAIKKSRHAGNPLSRGSDRVAIKQRSPYKGFTKSKTLADNQRIYNRLRQITGNYSDSSSDARNAHIDSFLRSEGFGDKAVNLLKRRNGMVGNNNPTTPEDIT